MSLHKVTAWISIRDEVVRLGEMVCELAARETRGAFRYDPGYLAREDAFPVDPVSLPLESRQFAIQHPGIFPVFEDSLPDDWGRKVLARRHKLTQHQQNLPTFLILLAGSGIGALSYGDTDVPGSPPKDVSYQRLDELVMAAEKFERGEIDDFEITMLLAGGSSPGGARPKAAIYDEELQEHCIAKFPSIKDEVDAVGIEAASMYLAGKAGLEVPATRTVPCAGRRVLLVRRFDLTPHGRRHMISFQTLLRAGGYCNHRYEDMLRVLRRVSARPEEDSLNLFRQMVFNAVVNNTDDHLKNFWMFHDINEGWRLTPAFDLNPDVRQSVEHVLVFNDSRYSPSRKKLERMGRDWGIPKPDNVVEQVFSAVEGWRDCFDLFEIPAGDIRRFRDIDDNLMRL